MTETQSVTAWYLDKGLWATVLGVLTPFLSKLVGLDLDAEKLAYWATLILGFVVSHKAKSGKILVEEIRAKAVSAVAKDKPSTSEEIAKGLNELVSKPAP